MDIIHSDNANQRPQHQVLIAALPILAWLWIYWDTLVHMVSVWSGSETYKHCFFIPLISAYLIYEKRHAIQRAQIKNQALILPVLILCQLLFVIVEQLGINLLMHVAAYGSLVLIVWAMLGNTAFRIILFPMAYLGFMVPFGEELVPLLQEITADFSVLMLHLFNIPVYREGLYLYIPNGTFHVAEACAGIRFLIGTFAIGTLFAYLNYQKYWKRGLFILTCAIVPVIANGFRAFGIIIIGYLSDMEHATGADHLVYGWFFFAFVLVLLFFLGSIGADKFDSVSVQNDSTSKPDRHFSVLTSGLLIVILITPSYLFSLQQAPKVSQAMTELDMDRLITSHFTQTSQGQNPWVAETAEDEIVWQGQIDGVMAKIIYVDEGQGKELVSSRHRIFDNDEWTQVKFDTLQVSNNGVQTQVRLVDVVNVLGVRKTLMSWYQVVGLQSSQGLRVKWQQFMNRLNGDSAHGFFIVVELSDADKASTASSRTEDKPKGRNEEASRMLAAYSKLFFSVPSTQNSD